MARSRASRESLSVRASASGRAAAIVRPFWKTAHTRGVGLPADPDRLAKLVKPDDQARLAAALTRVSLSRR